MNTKDESFINLYSDEVDLKRILRTFLRNVKSITFITGAITLGGIIGSYSIKPIYKGSFDIVIKTENDSIDNLGGGFRNLFEGGADLIESTRSNLKTQAFILKSPSVLLPVFDYVKINDTDFRKNLDYKTWLNRNLEIEFQKGTEVLSINYKNNNKEFIINVLNKISDKYKEYSKSDREKKLTSTIKFLNQQKTIYKEKSTISRKNLNLFSIENGLGDIDGFVDLSGNNSNFNFNFSTEEDLLKAITSNSGLTIERNNKAGQRYKKQFNILEQYEAEYINLASRLKPNAKTLTDLQVRIEKLKSSLKRPNEILLKFRELSTIAERDEAVLKGIEDRLVTYQLEKVKQQDPWTMISKPTIDRGKVKPKRSRIALACLIFGILFSYGLAIYKERKSGIVYELNCLKEKLNCNYLETLYVNKLNLSKNLFKAILNKYNKSKIGIIDSKNIEVEDNQKSENQFMSLFNKINIINLNDEECFNNFDKILIIAQEGKLNNNQIIILNKFIKIYKEKFIGFIYLKEF